RAGLTVYFPDHRAVLLGHHAALAHVRVRTDAHIEHLPVRPGSERLRPVVVELRRELGNHASRHRYLGLAFLVWEFEQGVLVGDVERVPYQREAVGRIEPVDQDGVQFRHAVAVGIAQQADAVTAGNAGLALGLDETGDDVLGPNLRGTAPPSPRPRGCRRSGARAFAAGSCDRLRRQ